jgi:metallo-beta-lactamase class B
MLSRLVLLSFLACSAHAQLAQTLVTKAWTDPFPPFRIVGNVYWVGTYDLSSYLIVTPEGDMLINTGLADSVPQIRSNIETLGFKVSDIKILMATHAHWDHVAGMAEMKRITGARLLATEADAVLLEDGGKSDFRWGGDPGAAFAPVKVDRKIKNGEKVRLGGMELTVHHHPGHTKGAASFSFTVQENGRGYRVLIANPGAINAGVVLRNNPKYPNIVEDYARTFHDQKELTTDLFLASHAAQFRMHDKYKPGDPYNPDRFVDPQGFRASVERLEKIYLDQLDRELKSK